MTGIGIDIIEIKRFKKKFYSKKDFIFEKIFTEKEFDYCISKANPAKHFAAKFAAKEAVRKSLSSQNIFLPHLYYLLKSIEIRNDLNGKPSVFIKNKKLQKYNIEVSISHNETQVVATTIISNKNQND